MSLFSMLNIGLSGLNTAESMGYASGQNQSNVKNEMYTKQRANITSGYMSHAAYGEFGTGSKVVNITRTYDVLLAKTTRNEGSSLSYWEQAGSHMSDIMNHFKEIASSQNQKTLGDGIQNYFDAWAKLASLSPGNTDDANVKRINLLENADIMVKKIREGYDMYIEKKDNINDKIVSAVAEINSISKNITDLNDKIVAIEIKGQYANDLRDHRDALIKKISDFSFVTVTENPNSSLNINIAGHNIVAENRYYNLETKMNSEGDYDIYWVSDESDNIGVNITDRITSGKLGGDIETRDKIIPRYIKGLDDLAKTIIISTNEIHSKGQGLQRFTSISSDFSVDNPRFPLSSAVGHLPYDVKPGTFEIKVYEGEQVYKFNIDIDPKTDTLLSISKKINMASNSLTGIKVESSVTPENKLKISVGSGLTFSFGEDTSGFVVASGLNNFFKGTNSSNIDLDDRVKNNPKFIATGLSGEPGDNIIANEMVNLKNKRVADDDTITVDQFYSVYNGTIASDKNRIDIFTSTRKASYEQYTLRLKSITGVVVQEEVVEMSMVTAMYQANARYITAVDEMLNIVVNGLGLVGR